MSGETIQATETVKRYETADEWRAEARKLFGDDPRAWRFKCPSCGGVQTLADFERLEIASPESKVHFSCIGRWSPARSSALDPQGDSPCDYTLGGLLNFGTAVVTRDDGGEEVYVFEFAQEGQ